MYTDRPNTGNGPAPSIEPKANMRGAMTGPAGWTVGIVAGALLFLVMVRGTFRNVVVRMPG